MAESVTAVRGPLVYFVDDPFLTDPRTAFVHEADGLVLCRNGKIEAVGAAGKLMPALPAGVVPTHYPDCLISAGFIDTHIHYVQTGIIGAFGEQLLEWLDNYAFVAEQAFRDEAYSRTVAKVFCDQLLRNGTTSALVYCAVFPQSVDALFAEASARNMRLIAGKVLMDRNAPAALLDTAKSGYDDSKALIAKWHGRGRNLYAITPRFAATSTPEQLELAGALWKEHPGVFVQSHISENVAEIAWVRKLFLERDGYLDVYGHYGLTGRRSTLAHGVHLSEAELCACHDTGTAIAHCPTSNLFLGSGLFKVNVAKDPRRPVHVGMGTDIGAGTSFSMLATMGDAYKVAQLNGYPMDAIKNFYLATLGGARALALDQQIGTLQPGFEADLVVLDPNATALLKFRNERSKSIEETMFVLMTMGDDRAVKATYLAGNLSYARDNRSE
jgi:guanine deaminase